MSIHPLKLAVAASLTVFTLNGPLSAGPAEDFLNAKTVKQARAAGAQQISGASIQKIMAGRTFKQADWTWTIKKNGTQSSKATDGSWSDAGTWQIKGNQYCRESGATEGKTICSDVYFLGRDLRFTQDANPKKLLDWHVSY